MAYNLIVTERAENLLDKIINYMLYHLKNEQAASHLLDSVEKIYERLEENPCQFVKNKDPYLKQKGYREAVLTDMNYMIVFRVEGRNVYIMGIFHQLEDFRRNI